MRLTKKRLDLVFSVIDWEGGASFLQSIKNRPIYRQGV